MCFKKKKKETFYVFEEDLIKRVDKDKYLFSKDDYVTIENEQISLSNPFLYKYDSLYLLNSIEDFGLIYRSNKQSEKIKVYLRSILRNQYISKKEKFKVFKKYYKSNKQDYKIKIKDLKSRVSNSNYDINTIKKVNIKKVHCLILLFSVILFILISFGLNILNLSLNVGFINKLNGLFISNNYKNSLFLTYFISGFSIVLYLGFLFWYYLKQSKIKRLHREYLRYLKKYFKKNKRIFKKQSNKIFRYYKKNILNDLNDYLPIGLNKLWNSKLDYSRAKDLNTSIEDNNRKLKKINKITKVLNILLLTIICITNLGLLIYTLISLIF